ncbi:MAG: questin oxidase family protein [Cyanobium sp.]
MNLSDILDPTHADFHALLRAGVDFDPLYPTRQLGPLADHLPMALSALHAHGASNADLQRFRAAYARKLVPVRVAGTGPISLSDDWESALGCEPAYPALLAAFTKEISTHGRDAVLRRWLPRLVDALAVQALHSLIRVAVATTHPVDEELAAALAYWCTSYVAVPRPSGERREGSVADLFAAVRTHPEGGARPLQESGFGARLIEFAGRPAFAEISGWRPPGMDLAAMAHEAARVYLGTGDFFALHMVTGSHALRLLLLWMTEHEAVFDRWWQALAATYVIIGAPDYSRWCEVSEAETLPEVGEVLDAAIASLAHDDPEHVVKLLWSAREEFLFYGFAEHARIVARLVARQKE